MFMKEKKDIGKILEDLNSGNFNFNKLIQLEDFKWVLKSILDSGADNAEWKADLIEFINSDSKNATSMFFYDMLPFVRFVNEPANDSAAYTTPDHRIWMNAPKGFGIGKEDYKWEFIYYHECMHQLWDTFDVQKNIEKQFGSCDQMVLNIASDCVINDFLHVNKNMPYPTDGLVTPEFIKQKYGVEYDRSRDTQFGLYEKLMKVADQINKNQPPQQPNGDGNGQQGKSGQNGQGQGNQQGNQKGNQKSGGQGKGQNQGQQGNGGQNGKSGQNGQGQGQGQGQDGSNGNGQGNGGNVDKYSGTGDIGNEPTSDYFKRLGDQTVKKYSGKITGAFGEFVRKCKTSTTEEKHEGVVVRQRRGAAWNKALDRKMDTFIYQQVIATQREVEQTYHRLKRGTRPVKMGEPLNPGVKIKDDKLNITVAFYIDRSGSMGDQSVGRCFSLAYQLSDKIRKNYSSEKVVGEIGFRYFAFNDYMKEIPKGQTVSCDGCTMSLKDILSFVEENTSTDLVNIIITDAEFTIEKQPVVQLVKKMPGMFFLIANQPKPECEDIERTLKGKFVYLQAGSDWEMQ